jgi:adenylate kinase family enzyme
MSGKKNNYILDPSDPEIIFVLGGPGSGKGTQCERLVRDFHYYHISVGDVLRDEVKSGSEEGKKLDELMKEAKLVSDELVVGLLKKKINSAKA